MGFRIELTCIVILLIATIIPQQSWSELRRQINFITSNEATDSDFENALDAMNQMNISMMRKLNRAKSQQDFAEAFGFLSTSKNGKIDARIGSPEEIVDAVNAGCTPLLSPVHLSPSKGNNNSKSVMFLPNCVLLPRCGGCCYGTLLSCQPESTKEVKLKVLQIDSLSLRRKRTPPETVDNVAIVNEIEHVHCACKCTVKETDCNPQIHSYSENECACKCTNKKKESDCLKKDQTHFWDSGDCSCYCKKLLECSTGFNFEHKECRCKRSLSGSSHSAIDFAGLING